MSGEPLDPVERIRQQLGIGQDATEEETAAASEGRDGGSGNRKQFLTNQAAAFLGDIASKVPDQTDLRIIIRIMYAAVQ